MADKDIQMAIISREPLFLDILNRDIRFLQVIQK